VENENTTGGQPWCLQSSSSTHSSSQPGGISPGHTSPKALPGSADYSKAEYTNTQQDLPVGDNYFTNSKHERLLATGFLLLKSNKEYVLTFKILAQVLVGLIFTKLAIWCRQCCTIQLFKHKIRQLPSLGVSWLVEYVVSDNGERPAIDWFKTLQGRPKHTVVCLREDNHHTVPKNPQVGIKGHNLWCRLSGRPREAPRFTIHHR
jgi:hypothetical protein